MIRIVALFVSLLAAPALLAADDMEDMSQPLEIHFGGDVGFAKQFGDASTPAAFQLGTVDTMLHGRLARAVSVMAEVVYEGAEDGTFGFDVERLMITYAPRTWLQISAGRFHTPLGYWNTAYHHARWMYTTTAAPLFSRFEDQQGPLPTHTIGLLVHGLLPSSGGLKIEYDACVGNGRGPKQDPPQQFADIDEGKSICGGLHFAVGGLRAGISGIVDSSTFPAGATLKEQIGVADVHWRGSGFEAILEGAVIHHDLTGIGATNLGGYAQLGYFVREDLQIYGRAERFSRDSAEAYLTTPTATTLLGGGRWEMVPSAALKVEGGWESLAGVAGPYLRGQVAWLF